MQHIIEQAGMALAAASKGNPIVAVITVFLFYVAFSVFEALIEKILFGMRFEHILDILFVFLFMSFAAYSVYCCGVYNNI